MKKPTKTNSRTDTNATRTTGRAASSTQSARMGFGSRAQAASTRPRGRVIHLADVLSGPLAPRARTGRREGRDALRALDGAAVLPSSADDAPRRTPLPNFGRDLDDFADWLTDDLADLLRLFDRVVSEGVGHGSPDVEAFDRRLVGALRTVDAVRQIGPEVDREIGVAPVAPTSRVAPEARETTAEPDALGGPRRNRNTTEASEFATYYGWLENDVLEFQRLDAARRLAESDADAATADDAFGKRLLDALAVVQELRELLDAPNRVTAAALEPAGLRSSLLELHRAYNAPRTTASESQSAALAFRKALLSALTWLGDLRVNVEGAPGDASPNAQEER